MRGPQAMTPIEEAVAVEVAKILSGRPKPRIRILLDTKPDGTMGDIHVRIEMQPRPPGEACAVVPLRR